MLFHRSGLLNFTDSPLRDAVKLRYLPRATDEDAMRWRLVNYFDGRANGPRKTVELPWQLFCLGSWDRLTALLAQPSFLTYAWEEDSHAVRRYWKHVEALSSTNRWEAYRIRALQWPSTHPNAARIAVELLSQWEERPPELETSLTRTINFLKDALAPGPTDLYEPVVSRIETPDPMLASSSDKETDFQNCSEVRNDLSARQLEVSTVQWTSVRRSDEPHEEPGFTPEETDQMRQRICESESEGNLLDALQVSERLTGTLRKLDKVKQLRTYLLIEARLLKKLHREDEARRVAREIIYLTTEHDPKTFDVFQGLLKELGIAGL
jgi:hypothetical protein